MDDARFAVYPIAGALGAEVSGADLSALDDATVALIRRALLDHQVTARTSGRTETEDSGRSAIKRNASSLCLAQ